MLTLATFGKDPEDIIDYTVNWANVLGEDTINTSTWEVEEGTVTVDSNSFTDTTTTVWVSGGVLSEKTILRNQITTDGGRTMDQSVVLRVRTK